MAKVPPDARADEFPVPIMKSTRELCAVVPFIGFVRAVYCVVVPPEPPVAMYSLIFQPVGADSCTIQNWRSLLPPVSAVWPPIMLTLVSGTVNLQAPLASEVHTDHGVEN